MNNLLCAIAKDGFLTLFFIIGQAALDRGGVGPHKGGIGASGHGTYQEQDPHHILVLHQTGADPEGESLRQSAQQGALHLQEVHVGGSVAGHLAEKKKQKKVRVVTVVSCCLILSDSLGIKSERG